MPGPCAPASAATRMPTWPPWNSKRASQLCRPRKKEPKSGRARPSRCGPTPPPLAGMAALYGWRPVCVPGPGATTSMTRRYGWGERGDRLVDAVPYGPWTTTTFVAGLRASGIIAPFVLDGPMTGEAFRAYVEQVLAPELEPGDAVVMDNLRPHKVAGVREAIQAAGASVLYLPSYSPDFNPIEHLFAKLKELLRKAAARTKQALWDAIGRHLDDFTPEECRNYLAHCGYEL